MWGSHLYPYVGYTFLSLNFSLLEFMFLAEEITFSLSLVYFLFFNSINIIIKIKIISL